MPNEPENSADLDDRLYLQALENRDKSKRLIARNVATNGRVFMLMLFGFSLITWSALRDPWWGVLALLSILPVGAAVILDGLPAGRARNLAATVLHAFGAALWLAAVVNVARIG